MDFLFSLAVLFLIGCFLFRKKLGIFFHSKKRVQELPMAQECLERPTIATYKILAFNSRDYKDTKELENMMELRLEQCLAGISRQGSKYEVALHSTGYVIVYLIRYWY